MTDLPPTGPSVFSPEPARFTESPPKRAVDHAWAPGRPVRRKPWYRRPAPLIVGSVLCIAILSAGAIGGIYYSNVAADASAKTAFGTAVHELALAEITDNAVDIDLAATEASAVAVSARVTAILAGQPALFDEPTRAGIDLALQTNPATPIDAAEALVDGNVSVPVTADPLTRRLPAGSTRAQYVAGEKALQPVVSQLRRDITDGRASIRELAAFEADVLDVFAAGVQAATPAVTAAVLEAAPSADPAVRDQATATLTALTDAATIGDDTVYAAAEAHQAALAAVTASHAAVEEQNAIAAAEAANTETYADPDTGQSRPNPSYAGGGSSSGSTSGGSSSDGSSSGGGSTGGGSSSGGSDAAPAKDTNRYVTTNSFYTPGCDGGEYGSDDPGPGGTITAKFTFPWDYYIEGNWIYWKVCT